MVYQGWKELRAKQGARGLNWSMWQVVGVSLGVGDKNSRMRLSERPLRAVFAKPMCAAFAKCWHLIVLICAHTCLSVRACCAPSLQGVGTLWTVSILCAHLSLQVGIELKFKDAGYRHMAAVSHVPELAKVGGGQG